MRANIVAAITGTVLAAAAARSEDLPTLSEPYRLMTLPANPATLLVVDTKTAASGDWKDWSEAGVLPVLYLPSKSDDPGTENPSEPKQ